MCLTYASGRQWGVVGVAQPTTRVGWGYQKSTNTLVNPQESEESPPTVHAPKREQTQYNQRNPPTIYQASESNARRDEIY